MRGGARDAELLKHARNVEVLVGVASGSATTALGHRAQSRWRTNRIELHAMRHESLIID